MRNSVVALTMMSVALFSVWACEPAQPTDQATADDDPSAQAPEVVIGDGGSSTPKSDSGKDLEQAPAEKRADAGGGSSSGSSGATPPPPKDKPVCKTSFTRDVLPAFDQAGCGAILCHGTRFAPKLRIEVGDPTITYGELTTYKLGGKPYVKPLSTNIDDSAIACHLTNKCGIKMPPGGGTIPTSFATIVASWLSCGAPKN